MKISALPQGQGGSPGQSLGLSDGRSASSEKLAAAKAIMAGEAPIRVTRQEPDRQAERIQSIRSLKMSTNRTPEPRQQLIEDPVIPPVESTTSDPTVQANAIEETKPLSPQLAALAKQRRAIQVKEMELQKREEALKAQPTQEEKADLIAKLKSEPLSVLREHGVTYDQLTQAIMDEVNGVNPEIKVLRDEIKALKEGVDKNFTDHATGQEEAALTEMLNEAEDLAKDGDTYEMIRSQNAYDQVLRKIHTTYKTTGRVLDVSDAMNQIETQLLESSLKLASIGKVRNKLSPPTQSPQQSQPQMRTLTNRDGVTPTMSRKARAVAAMLGTLK
jgi:hypothetical protein